MNLVWRSWKEPAPPRFAIFTVLLLSTSGFLWIISGEYKKRQTLEGKLIEASFSFDKTGPNAFKCYQDPNYGSYSSVSECQSAALKQKRRAGVDQHCSATKLCTDDTFCNDRNVCQARKLIYSKCRPGECAKGFYCSPQTGRCTPKTPVPPNEKCGVLWPCADGTCIDGECVPDTSFQVDLQMNSQRFIIRVDAKDYSSMAVDSGLGVIGWDSGKNVVLKNWYSINSEANGKSETARFLSDSREWKRYGVQFLMIVVWKVFVPSRIDWRVRQLIERFGGRMIRYIDNNYVIFFRVPDRMLIHEDVAKVLRYVRTESVPALKKI